ncbi:MAG: hypothetical protein HOH95_03210 [Dehalococcoidia bacterium]|nr:hypothetical protein [Dehalococcoidia bacterium]
MANFGYESLTVSTSAVGITDSVRSGRDRALITVETDQIRFRSDGPAPTTSEGHLVDAGASIILESAEELVNFKAIRVTADATLKVTSDERGVGA